MKALSTINWIILSIYILVTALAYFKGTGPGSDPAGRAMTQGYLILFVLFIAVLLGLNFIQVKWVKILTLVLGVVPAVYLTIYNYQSQASMDAYIEERKNAESFQDPFMDLLLNAIKNDKVEEVKQLLGKDGNNIDINLIGSTNKKTLLDFAIQQGALFNSKGSYEIIEALIQQGADPNIYHIETASTIASYVSIIPIEVFELLLEAGADPNSKDEKGEAILYKLLEHGVKENYEKIELLLKHGADPNIALGTDLWKLNYAPLNYAANRKLWKICGLLIDHGADMNFNSPEGNDFWYYLAESKTEYEEKGEVPEDYQALINHPKVIATRN